MYIIEISNRDKNNVIAFYGHAYVARDKRYGRGIVLQLRIVYIMTKNESANEMRIIEMIACVIQYFNARRRKAR